MRGPQQRSAQADISRPGLARKDFGPAWLIPMRTSLCWPGQL